MIERKSTFFLGVFILIISSSFLGLPSFWKNLLLFVSGLAIMGLSVKFSKFTLPKKSIKKIRKKEKTETILSNIVVESNPLVQSEESIEPKAE